MDTTQERNRGIPLPYLALWRAGTGLNRTQLAERIFVSPTLISRVEHGGHCEWKTARKIASTLGVTLEQLVLTAPTADQAQRLREACGVWEPVAAATPQALVTKLDEQTTRYDQRGGVKPLSVQRAERAERLAKMRVDQTPEGMMAVLRELQLQTERLDAEQRKNRK